jgi:hypothetical protein
MDLVLREISPVLQPDQLIITVAASVTRPRTEAVVADCACAGIAAGMPEPTPIARTAAAAQTQARTRLE